MSHDAQRNRNRPLDRSAVLANYGQSAVLLAGFAALLLTLLWPTLGRGAIAVAMLALAAVIAVALRVAPGILLQFYGARPYEAGDRAQLDGITTELSRRAGLRYRPQVFVVPSMLLSAFSVGTSERYAIALTEGLLRRLTMRELAAVLAREIAHAQRGDLLVFGIADIISRCAQAFYYLGLALLGLNALRSISGGELFSWQSVILLILSPALMSLLQLAVSHQREFEADRGAALLTGDPIGVASAVSRLDATLGTVFDELIPPVPSRKVPLPSMLRFPPPSDQRIARLNAFNAPPMPPLDISEGPRISLIGVGPIEMRPRYRWSGIWF